MKKLIPLILIITLLFTSCQLKGDFSIPEASVSVTEEPATALFTEYLSVTETETEESTAVGDYPPMVMFNDILYSSASYLDNKEDLTVAGKIESCIDYGVPTAITKIVDYRCIGQYSAWRMVLHTLGTALGGIAVPYLMSALGAVGTLILAGALQAMSGAVYYWYTNFYMKKAA